MLPQRVATVTVDGGGQASGTHGPLDLLPAPGGAEREDVRCFARVVVVSRDLN